MGLSGGSLAHLDVVRPTLLVDRERVARNIQRMAGRAEVAGVTLRPHFKTHRSVEVGRWFRDFGVEAITVSSVEMARYFADDGWNDITIAFPLNVRELAAIGELAERVRLGVLVDSAAAAEALGRVRTDTLSVWMKVDTGYGRAGIAWDDDERLRSVAQALRSAGLATTGVLSHNGLTYRERTREGVLGAHREGLDRLRSARDLLGAAGAGDLSVSTGDTPGASIGCSLEGVDEIRPGNFVFHDLTQVAIGTCTPDEVAVAVACPVVSVYPRRRRALIYGGAVHLSMESQETAGGGRTYGRICPDWPVGTTLGPPVMELSQEHGIFDTGSEAARGLKPGDLACVLPVHSCLTCNLHSRYLTLDGEWLGTMRS